MKINQTSDFSGSIKWDVSKNGIWKKFIGTQIIGSKISWDTVIATEEKAGKTEKFI